MTIRTDSQCSALSPAAKYALATVLNLRKLTAQTGTRTTRSQNEVLQKLNSEDLAAVANALANEQ